MTETKYSRETEVTWRPRTTEEITIQQIADENVKKAKEEGLSRYDWRMERIFDVAVKHLDRAYSMEHPKYKQLKVRIEDTDITFDHKGNRNVLTFSWFVPSWVNDVCRYITNMRAGESNQDFNERYKEILDVLKSGLDGDLKRVENYLGMEELIREYDRETSGLSEQAYSDSDGPKYWIDIP